MMLLHFAIAAMLFQSAQGNQSFEPADHSFSVTYPNGWEQLRSSLDGSTDSSTLDILNFPNSKRAEGVVIIKNGAEIVLKQLSEGDSLGTGTAEEILSRSTVPVRMLSYSACHNVKVVTSHWEVGPGVFERDVDYECITSKHKYNLRVRSFEKDPHQKRYEQTAVEILASLKEPK